MATRTRRPAEIEVSSGFLVKADTLSHEKHLASAIIFQAWKDACEGDRGAFSFASNRETLFPFWCLMCDLNVNAARSSFRRLEAGQIKTIVKLFETSPFRRNTHYSFTHAEILETVKRFTALSKKFNRTEVYTCIAMEMEKRVSAIEYLFFNLVRTSKTGGELPVELTKVFWKAWNGELLNGRERERRAYKRVS
jgi:hypothetical protein